MIASRETFKQSISRLPLFRVWWNWRSGAKLSRLDFGGINARLSEVAQTIPAIFRDVDTPYLSSGRALDPLTNASEMLTTQTAELLKLAVGQADADLVVNGTSTLLAPPFAYLDKWREQVRHYETNLTQCEQLALRLEKSQSAVDTLVAPLRHIQAMFRIESARLSEEVRQIFIGLTNEIASVHTEVNDTFKGQIQTIAKASATLEQVKRTLKSQVDHLDLSVDDRRCRISDSIQRLRTELARNGQREMQLTSTSAAVANSISSVVISLQTHDICSQRLANVRTAIEQASGLLAGGAAQLRRRGQSVQQAQFLLTVQAAQVKDVYGQFQSSETELRAALDEIAAKVSNFDTECLLLKDFQEMTVATNGSVELSLEMMDDLGRLLRDVIRVSQEFRRLLQPLEQVTTRLTDVIEALSAKMRVIALNAQVQAVHIGDGTGLEVLAAQTAQVSNNISRNAEGVSADTQKLVGLVKNLVNSFDTLIVEGEAALAAFEGESCTHASTLHALRDRTLVQLNYVGNAVDEIGRSVQSLADDSQARESAVQPLRTLADSLEQLASSLKLSSLDSAAADVETQYKMHSERHVHSNVLSDLGIPRSDENSVPEGALTNTPIESVELF